MENTTQEQPVAEAAPTVAKASQKDAVYKFVLEALEAKPAEGQTLKDLVTKETRKVVRQKLFTAIRANEVSFSKQKTDSDLKKYCSGLINNWLKKDPRFS